MTRFTRIAAIVLLLLALILGAYAWLLGRKPATPAPTPQASQAPAAAPQAQHAVLVAAKPLVAGQPIAQDDVRVVQLPIQLSDGLRDASAAVGRVPVVDLAANTPITEAQLVSGLALRLEPGERAVAVKADEVMGVGNRIRPGDFVDVFFVLKSDNREIAEGQARLLLPRLRVLAFGSASVDGGPAAARSGGGGSRASNDSGPAPQSQQRQEQARTTVLAVPVDEVNRLTLGDANARLVLALRRPDDLQLPDPNLFAALPTALQPLPRKAGEPPRAPLEGLDRAQAGLATADLARGGTPTATRTATAVANTVRTSAPRAAAAPSGQAVEVIRGGQRDTLHY
ncbi:Flp pilus assembly protein CpaB [Xenophilus arseniciresistens]|uniref:Flp pilus assembly protein CpaB n=1 Tax=Xenophilus arseniciresistens TaxID=1283306 RepID=A0AAE3T1P0_9BURK|nr:Flp pilus assembly protein CpaB [Xenophilus arseniciresistens]MDA7418176.1 Flp pilus assembly protein CpaB [Xenophilus arseniciresistens]